MPYLQLDVPGHYPSDVKRRLARRMGEIYADVMETTRDRVRVAFRELGEGGLWQCTLGEPRPGAVLSCEIRRGRSPEQRARLAQSLADACTETLGLSADQLLVEFTQHGGDDFYRPGRGLASEWTPAEAREKAKVEP